MSGTNFQIAVWQALQTIPYGMTSSYQDIARHLNKPNAYRAVGHANKRNPCPLIVPCHRVVGKNGQLTGYNNGLWRKQWLIDHEKRHAPLQTEGLDQISSRNRCV
jgi:methylated-DNA-[protein]-cysteine S-methyltransferase